jgi:hypothetical protein
MWQAYYAKERVHLFALLATTLREQYHYSWAVAASEAFHLARAAATFSDLRSNYDVVLPDLERAYATAQSWLHADFDPHAVARAELAWWVARRTPGHNRPEEVGELIAELYVALRRPLIWSVSAASRRSRCAGGHPWRRPTVAIGRRCDSPTPSSERCRRRLRIQASGYGL